MKKGILCIAIVLFLLLAGISKAEAARVKGYFKGNGTYVQPHYRSIPNSYKWDNYSSKGNMNPYNGRSGYKKWW